MTALANERIAYFNGDYVPESEVRVPFRDRSWIFGDGAFDMTRTFNGRLFKIREHVERLYRSLKVLRIDPGLSPAEMIAISEEVNGRNLHLLGPDEDQWVGQRISRGVNAVEGDNWDHYGPTVIVEIDAPAVQGAGAPLPRRHRRGRALGPPRLPGRADAARQDPQLSEPDHGRPRGPRPFARGLDDPARRQRQPLRGPRRQHLRLQGRPPPDPARALRAARASAAPPRSSSQPRKKSRSPRPTSTSTTPMRPRKPSSPRPASASARSARSTARPSAPPRSPARSPNA